MIRRPPRSTLFPSRRSSDLVLATFVFVFAVKGKEMAITLPAIWLCYDMVVRRDRKSTRLNSSHEWISYAVFCLKKKSDSRTTLLTPPQESCQWFRGVCCGRT